MADDNLPIEAIRNGDVKELQSADLRDADLRDAGLWDTDLQGADLRYADLQGADLRYADLRDADLSGADLQGAYLQDADLQGAYLQGAYLQGADLSHTNLSGANLQDAILPEEIVPEDGSFVAYKQTSDNIVKVRIPEDADRVSAFTSRKCRAEYVETIEVLDLDGQPCNDEVAHGWYDEETVYREGDETHSDSFDDDRREVCTHGIHFFVTKEEATDWR